MRIALELDVNDEMLERFAGENLKLVKQYLSDAVLDFVVNELDCSLDNIVYDIIENETLKEEVQLKDGIAITVKE